MSKEVWLAAALATTGAVRQLLQLPAEETQLVLGRTGASLDFGLWHQLLES